MNLNEKKDKLVEIVSSYVNHVVKPYASFFSDTELPYFMNFFFSLPVLIGSARFQLVPKNSSVSTAATDGKTIYFNENFLNSILSLENVDFRELTPTSTSNLSEETKKAIASLHVFFGIIFHELMHEILKHKEIAKVLNVNTKEEKFLLNIATDIYINELLNQERVYLRKQLKRKVSQFSSLEIVNPYALPDFFAPTPYHYEKRKDRLYSSKEKEEGALEYDKDYFENVKPIGIDREFLEEAEKKLKEHGLLMGNPKPFSILEENEPEIYKKVKEYTEKLKNLSPELLSISADGKEDNTGSCEQGDFEVNEDGNSKKKSESEEANSQKDVKENSKRNVKTVTVKVGDKEYSVVEDVYPEEKNKEREQNSNEEAEKRVSNNSIIRDMIMDSIISELSKKEKGAGTINIAEIINELYAPTDTWKRTLERFKKEILKKSKKKTWTQLRKGREYYANKWKILFKGEKQKNKEGIFFYLVVDSSSSMSMEEYKMAKSLLLGALVEGDVKSVVEIQHTDTVGKIIFYTNQGAYEGEIINGKLVKTGKRIPFEKILTREFGGGTSHKEVFDLLEKNVKSGDGIVFVTDFASDVQEIYNQYSFLKKGYPFWLITDPYSVEEAKVLEGKIGQVALIDTFVNRYKMILDKRTKRKLKKASSGIKV